MSAIKEHFHEEIVNGQQEQSFNERLREIDVENSVKMAKLNLLLDLTKEISELGICIDCTNEYTYLESNQNLKTCKEILDIIQSKIKELK